MAISVDATTTANNGGASSITLSLTVASNARLYVALIFGNNRTVSSVIWNGSESLTAAKSLVQQSAYFGTAIYYIDNPTPGAHSVVATLSGTSTNFRAAAISFTGAATSSLGATASVFNGAQTSPASLSITTTANNSYVLGAALLNHFATGITPGAGETSLLNAYDAGDGYNLASSYKQVASAGASSTSYTFAAGNDAFCMVSVEVLQAIAATASQPSLTLTGVGA